ncbi:MAG TPA: hypothetical protein VMT53_22945 [Terriglobales bacterium]|nr:hypothetical protein [Terriglobales bacterium]
MKFNILLLAVLFTIVSVALAQEQSQAPAPPSGTRSQMRAERRQKMMEMHKQQVEAMKADLEKMKSSLTAMKANVANISDAKEKARWQANVDMWETMVGHMDQMQKQMEWMGPGMHPGMMGGPPSEQQPQ